MALLLNIIFSALTVKGLFIFMNLLPIARQADIIVHETGNELLVYHLKTNQAYALNETSRIVYQACDGKTSFDELKNEHRLTDDLIYLSLDGLKKNDLLEDSYQTEFTGVSRREMIRKVGLASAISLPLVTSLVAPRASQAASNNCTNVGTQPFPAPGTCPSSCSNCQCARDYCEAHAIPCCSGPFPTTNFNGATVFCNCF
jgi:hypothetical protein